MGDKGNNACAQHEFHVIQMHTFEFICLAASYTALSSFPLSLFEQLYKHMKGEEGCFPQMALVDLVQQTVLGYNLSFNSYKCALN